MLDTLQNLMDKFRINIRQIINNSDNTMEDIRSEGYLVLYHFLDKIKDNERVFINELRNSCLKFNKYGKRITEKSRWEEYNKLEEDMFRTYNNSFEINEDIIVGMEVLKTVLNKDEIEFLLYYYENGGRFTSQKYDLKECTVRKRVQKLIEKAKKELIQ